MRVIAFGLALSVLSSGAAVGQGFKSLKLTATAEKLRIVPGEPLVLRVQVSNPGTQPVAAHHDMGTRYGMLDVSISPPDKPFGRYLGAGWGTFGARPLPKPIAPGETLAGEVVILYRVAMYGRDDLLLGPTVLDEPGIYKVQVTWSQIGFEDKIAAAEIQVEVAKPTGPDADMWEAMRADKELGTFLARGAAGSASNLESKVGRLLAAHPESIQAGHFDLALGRHFLERGDPKKAIPHLERALQGPPKSALRRGATLALADAYARTEAFPKAKTLLDGAATDFEGSAQKVRFEQMRAELAKRSGGMFAHR